MCCLFNVYCFTYTHTAPHATLLRCLTHNQHNTHTPLPRLRPRHPAADRDLRQSANTTNACEPCSTQTLAPRNTCTHAPPHALLLRRLYTQPHTPYSPLPCLPLAIQQPTNSATCSNQPLPRTRVSRAAQTSWHSIVHVHTQHIMQRCAGVSTHNHTPPHSSLPLPRPHPRH